MRSVVQDHESKHLQALCVVILSNNTEILLKQHSFKIRGHDCDVIATRDQFPVIPAYAMTVHRSQGMTLSKVAVKSEVEERWRPFGMVCVILSKCTSLRGLWVSGLKQQYIKVSPDSCQLIEKISQLRGIFPLV